MNIVMICRLYEPHIGGVERHVAGVSREAIKEGNRVDVFTLKHERSLPTFEIRDGIRIHRKPDQLHSHVLRYIFPTLLKTILRLSGLTRNAQDDKVERISNFFIERDEIWGWMFWNLPTFLAADIIQIHDVFFWYWPIRIVLPWKKVYITFHGFEAGSLPTEKAKKTRQMITRWTRGNMAVGAWIEKWYGTKADVVTYGAGDCEEISNSKTNSKINCVFIGRISADTGADVYEKVLSQLPNVQLDMYGEGAKLGTIEDSCLIFPRYDIACVSSYLSIVEAMQSKVLVVAYAADELKYDYLTAHPRAQDMIIVRSQEELRDFCLSYQPADYTYNVQHAYTWARQQTWNRVYLKYKKLWNLK